MIGGNVYFIKPVGCAGPIKIGCSKHADERLKSLAHWSPVPLEIIYQEEGGYDLERNIHRCFADLHSHHEWFRPGERLLKAVERLVSGMKIADAIDLSDIRGEIHTQSRRGPRPECEVTKGLLSYKARVRHAITKARREADEHMSSPDDVDLILSRWMGYSGYKAPRKQIRPTEDEFRRLDEFIANPALHCISLVKKRAA